VAPAIASVTKPNAHKPASDSIASGAWTGRDLLGFQGVPAAHVRELLAATQRYASIATRPETRTGELDGKTVATLFFEDSTRTKTSFTLAIRRLSGEAIDLVTFASSVNKGETLVDTAMNVEAMGVSAMVVRAKQSGAAKMIADAVRCPVLNAGDGRHEHPTQALLDASTIAEAHARAGTFDLSGLCVAIVGDLGSSRVARSNIAALTGLGASVECVGPAPLVPAEFAALGQDEQGRPRDGACRVGHDLDAVLERADAVMMLRVQFERHGGDGKEGASALAARATTEIPSLREYRERYGLTRERAERLKPGAIVMHPGPMNRGLEIESEVADGPRSVILKQVSRGVAARMAALALVAGR
jgi:aspartate carbamoyltransferase catalytic subunit